MAEHGILRSYRALSVFLIGFGVLASACSGDAESSDPESADAAQDAATRSDAGDAARLDALSESRLDTAIDAVTSLDVVIDLVDPQTDSPRDAVMEGAADAPADLRDDREPDATDAQTADTGTDDALDVADASTADAGTVDVRTDDVGTDDAPHSADTRTVDAGAADVGAEDMGADDAPAADAPGIADAGSDSIEAAADAGAPNIIFVTSATYNGNLGGLAGADARCRQHAQAAGLSGTFIALLSTSTVDVKTRLGTARGWVRTDGKPFADRQQDLFGQSARTYYPPRVDEFGSSVPVDSVVMTGSSIDGTIESQGRTCNDWTSTSMDGGTNGFGMGYASHGSYGYLSYGWAPCPYTSRLICIEISRTSRVDPPPPPQARRTAFVSNAMYLATSGMGAADGLCTSEAAAASLPGTYKAFLATKLASAMSRFDLGGAPWVRVDGVVIATTAADFAAGNFLAPINVMANGTHLGNSGVWTGATGPSALGTATCNDWNPIDASTDKAIIGVAMSSSTTWSIQDPCNWTYGRVYCLQQ
jgi:hypothetical protein